MLLFNLNRTIRPSMKKTSTTKTQIRKESDLGLVIAAGIAALLSSAPLWASPPQGPFRGLDSLKFPMHDEIRDEDDILDEYPDYLRFVLEIGKSVNSRKAVRLANKYEALRKYSPKGAAKFLRGLRFEMVQKLQYAHLNPRTMNTSNPKMRAWVGRHLDKWYQEADEFLFRAVVYKRTGNRWY